MAVFTAGLDWKYRMRITIVPTLAKIARIFGFAWPKIGSYLGREALLTQANELPCDKPGDLPSPALNILFVTMIGGHTHNACVDALLAKACQMRGHRVQVVLCDQALPLCEVKNADNPGSWKRSCAKCWTFGSRLFAAFGIPVIRVSELVKDGVEYDPKWHEFVESALYKHYRVGVLKDLPDLSERRAGYEKSAAISAAVASKIIEGAFDRVVMSHGLYCTWGPILNTLTDANIPVVVYAKGKQKKTERFSWNMSADWPDFAEEWPRVKDIPLSEDDRNALSRYMRTRRTHSEDNLVYNFVSEEPEAQLYEKLGLDPAKPIYTAFTNVLWDASSAQREIVFDGAIDWIVETINWFGRHPNKQLIVRIHPAEVVIGTNQPFLSIIRDKVGSIPENVHLIAPDDKFNSWSLLRITNVGIVHTSTVGLELALVGKPCITVSKTHFRGQGFTVDAVSKEHYFELLDQYQVTEGDSSRFAELAERYAFLWFMRYELPFDFFYEPNHTDVRALSFSEMRSVLQHPSIDIFLNSLERKELFLKGK